MLPGIKIQTEIGSGLRGTVYSATEGGRTLAGRSLAVKVHRRGIHVDLSALARLKRSAPDRIRHPNIAPIEALGELPDGAVYYASPLLRGDSLDRLIADLRRGATDRPSLSAFAVGPDGRPHPQLAQRSAEVFAEALDGLALAHANGLTHRRLSPRNLILTPAGRLVITDFGGEASTDGGPDLVYRAPEQLEPYPQDVGPPADVYAMGVILYELLTRRLPFLASSPRELKAAIESGKLTPPREVVPELSAGLEACLLKAMALEPAERYRHAGELAQDLRLVLQGSEPAQATSRSRAARKSDRTAGRELRVWVRVAAAALILLGFVAWMWPSGSGKRTLLNPGLSREERQPLLGTASLAAVSQANVSQPAAQSARALAQLELEIASGARPPSDAFLAAWLVKDKSPELRRRALETLLSTEDIGSVLQVLGIGEGLPAARLDESAVYALSDACLESLDEPAARTLCAWDLEACELLDSTPAPADLHLDPNLSVLLEEDPPRDFCRRWIRARAHLDPESLLQATPRLARHAELVADLVLGLCAADSAPARNALERIVRDHPFTGGYPALGGLGRLGAHRELLELARGFLPAGLRARAVELLGETARELHVAELKTFAATSPELEIRRAAFAQLAVLDSKDALEAIPSAIYDLDLKGHALEWAERLSPETARELFLDLLGHNDPMARALAVEKLSRAGGAGVLEPLIARLLDARQPTRDAAIEVLLARGELHRIPSAMARHFGRSTRSSGLAERSPLGEAAQAWSSLADSFRRLQAQAGKVLSQAWAEAGLAGLTKSILHTALAR